MGLETYTSLSIAAGDTMATEKINKLAVTLESYKAQHAFYGAAITTTCLKAGAARTFAKGSDLILPFDTVLMDTSGFWNASNPQLLSIPDGFSSAEVSLSGAYPTGDWLLRIYKNGDLTTPLAIWSSGSAGVGNEHAFLTLYSNRIAVTAGDYFQGILLVSGSGTAIFDNHNLVNSYKGVTHFQDSYFRLEVRAFL